MVQILLSHIEVEVLYVDVDAWGGKGLWYKGSWQMASEGAACYLWSELAFAGCSRDNECMSVNLEVLHFSDGLKRHDRCESVCEEYFKARPTERPIVGKTIFTHLGCVVHVLVVDEAKSTGGTRVGIPHNDMAGDVAIRFEQTEQLIVVHVFRKVLDEEICV